MIVLFPLGIKQEMEKLSDMVDPSLGFWDIPKLFAITVILIYIPNNGT